MKMADTPEAGEGIGGTLNLNDSSEEEVFSNGKDVSCTSTKPDTPAEKPVTIAVAQNINGDKYSSDDRPSEGINGIVSADCSNEELIHGENHDEESSECELKPLTPTLEKCGDDNQVTCDKVISEQDEPTAMENEGVVTGITPVGQPDDKVLERKSSVSCVGNENEQGVAVVDLSCTSDERDHFIDNIASSGSAGQTKPGAEDDSSLHNINHISSHANQADTTEHSLQASGSVIKQPENENDYLNEQSLETDHITQVMKPTMHVKEKVESADLHHPGSPSVVHIESDELISNRTGAGHLVGSTTGSNSNLSQEQTSPKHSKTDSERFSDVDLASVTGSSDVSPSHSSDAVQSGISPTKSSSGSSPSSGISTIHSNHAESDAITVITTTSPADADESDTLLSELELEIETHQHLPNGLNRKICLTDIEEYKELKNKFDMLSRHFTEVHMEVKKLKDENQHQVHQLETAVKERDTYLQQLQGANKSMEDIYLVQAKELEYTIAKQEKDLVQLKEKLASHDSGAKRTINALQTEMKTRVDKASKLYEESRKEKEGMVIRYAEAEQKNIELQEKMQKNDKKMREMTKERESVIGQFQTFKKESQRMREIIDAKCSEVGVLKKEVERQKDTITSQDGKVKWAQNKLRAELETHKETKSKLDEVNRRMKQTKEEAEQIRRDCQAMVKAYQESEEIKSNTLDQQLKEKKEELQLQKQEHSDKEEVYQIFRRELENLKRKDAELVAELNTYKDKVKCMEVERLNQEQTLDKFKQTLQNQKKDNTDLYRRLGELENVETDLKKEKETVKSLRQKVADLEEHHSDVETDIRNCAKRELEHLEFTQNISDKNARLQSENTLLNTKLKTLTVDHEKLSSEYSELLEKAALLEKELNEEKITRQNESETLLRKLQNKSVAVEELARKLDDEIDEKKTLKRRHIANTKDLTRQLQQARRKLECYESKGGAGDRDSTSMGSMGSRTSSSGSLDTAGQAASGSGQLSRASSQEPSVQDECNPIVQVVEVDKNLLLEKIVRLQKAHARKNEKLEFLEDHINQLLDEIKRKTRIIQGYVLREESGALASEAMDDNKALLAKKGGIMASLYSSHAQDGAMNLDLSLEINHKLQAVLEDILLKNITLKENIETLGQEIARLSQENRQLQLLMHGKS